jgi:hypothetical protein
MTTNRSAINISNFSKKALTIAFMQEMTVNSDMPCNFSLKT